MWRYRTHYDRSVLATLLAVPTVLLVAAAPTLPLLYAYVGALWWLSLLGGIGIYIRTRWARDAGVGELAAVQREREGLRAFSRDLREPQWRAQAVRNAAIELLTADGTKAVIGLEVARSDGRPTGAVVEVPLGRTHPTEGNAGVVGLLVGRPNSGKTTTAIRLLHATAAADPRGSIIILDPKGDRALRNAGRAIAERHGTSYWEWSREAPLDPLESVTAGAELRVQAAVARIMAAQNFTEEYYKAVAQDAFTDVGEFLTLAGEPLSLAAMAAVLEPAGAGRLRAHLTAAARAGRISERNHQRFEAWFARQDPRSWNALAGAASRLTTLARSGLGVQFASAASGGRTIGDLAATPGVSYLYLNAGMWPDAALQVAELLAVALMQDVGAIAERGSHAITMFIDEVGAVPATRMDAMLQRGRSAGFSVYLAAQTLAGIGAATPELVSQITGTLSWLIGHQSIGQSEGGEDDAERIGRLGGTRIELELTTQTSGGLLALPTGAGSQRQVDAYIVNPNLIRSLPRGRSVVIDVTEPTTSPRRGRLCGVTPYQPPPRHGNARADEGGGGTR